MEDSSEIKVEQIDSKMALKLSIELSAIGQIQISKSDNDTDLRMAQTLFAGSQAWGALYDRLLVSESIERAEAADSRRRNRMSAHKSQTDEALGKIPFADFSPRRTETVNLPAENASSGNEERPVS